VAVFHRFLGLFVDTEKGNRPSFSEAAPADQAGLLCATLRELGVPVERVPSARMRVELVNDGPVTITLET
jgi:D-tyrosyl-tRNA(Tyr) deacylase